ncbi:MAG: LysM peptidoglycan-binding domain-containing protein [Verrucomicrobiota bacterium]
MKYFLSILALSILFLTSCNQSQKGTDAEDSSNPFFRQAIKYTSEQNYHAAIKEYEKALRVNPMVARAHKEMGILYSEKLGDAVSGIYHFQRYLQARPDASDSEKEQIQMCIDKAKIDFALTLPNSPIQNAEEIARINKENIDLKQSLAQTQMKLAKYETMIAQLKAGQPVEDLAEIPSSPAAATSVANKPAENKIVERVAPAIPVITPSSTMEKPALTSPSASNVPPPSSPITTGAARTHIIAKGDSLWKIAEKYYPGDVPVGVAKIKQANPETAKNERNLKLGQELIIPE